MKVYTHNDQRTFDEMYEIWHWMTQHFGAPIAHNDNLKRWTYGKDSRGYLGGMLIDGAHDIEWFDFANEADALMYRLRWDL